MFIGRSLCPEFIQGAKESVAVAGNGHPFEWKQYLIEIEYSTLKRVHCWAFTSIHSIRMGKAIPITFDDAWEQVRYQT